MNYRKEMFSWNNFNIIINIMFFVQYNNSTNLLFLFLVMVVILVEVNYWKMR